MTQLFLQKRKHHILPEPLGEFLDLHGQVNVIVLEMWYDRVTYPQLRKLAQEAYYDYEPDAVMIEKKASTISVAKIYECLGIQLLSICLIETKKHEHMQAVHHWKMEEFTFLLTKKWSKNLIDICATFPAGENDDIVDACTQAWLRIA